MALKFFQARITSATLTPIKTFFTPNKELILKARATDLVALTFKGCY
jgi:hypothetical protein